MECGVVQVALAGAALAPAAICDARSRSVPVWSLCLGWAAACVSVVYGVSWGGMSWWPAGAAAALGCACGGLLVVVSRRAMLGSADGHAVGALGVMLPWCDGAPLALCGVAAGCAAALAWAAALNAWYNLRDMAAGRPARLSHLFACHRKRPGERFAVAYRRGGPAYVDDAGTVRDADGDLFEPASSGGRTVRPAIPMVPFVLCGTLAAALYLMV